MEKRTIKINPVLVIEPRTTASYSTAPVPVDEQIWRLEEAAKLITKHAGLDKYEVYSPEVKTEEVEQFTFNCWNKQKGYTEDCKCAYDTSNGVTFPACCDEITREWIVQNPEQAIVAFPESTHNDWVRSLVSEQSKATEQ